jgi:hypothetical protein
MEGELSRILTIIKRHQETLAAQRDEGEPPAPAGGNPASTAQSAPPSAERGRSEMRSARPALA